MFYREAGQFKTTYAADMAIFPIRQDRIGIAIILLVAFVVVPLLASSFLLERGDDPVPGLLARRDRAQPAHRLHRPALARHRRLHGGRRLCLLQAHDAVSRASTSSSGSSPRASSPPRSARCSACRRCASRASISRSRRSRRSSSCQWCFIRIPWLYNYNISGAIEVPTRTLFGIPITGPNATPMTRYLVVLCDRRADDLDRLESRARPHRPHVDGGARHGHRGRADRHPAAAAPSCSPSRCRRSTAASPAR